MDHKKLLLNSGIFALCASVWSGLLFAQTASVPMELISYPSTIVVNGRIYTMDNKSMLSRNPGTIVSALAIRDGRIMATGTDEEMLRYAGPQTRIMDVKGKTVIPGIIETHVHPESTMNAVRLFEAERDAYSLPPGIHTAILLPSNDPQDTYAQIRQLIREHPPEAGEWVHVRLIPNEDTDYPDIGSLTNGIYEGLFTLAEFSDVIPDNPATLSSGTGPSAILQPGLVVRVIKGPDGKSRMEPLSVPSAAQLELSVIGVAGTESASEQFQTLFANNALQDRQDSFHAHIEQGCGFSEMYPHHMQHCSHRNFLLNQRAVDATLEVWPGFIQAANDVTGLSEIGREGDRGIVGGVFQESGAWERTVFPPRMPRDLTLSLMEEALKLYATAGVTMIASSVEVGPSMTAAFDLLRRDERLPIRWGYGYEMFRSPLLYPTNALAVIELGAHHGSPKVNEWFWPMGITDGGVGDSRQVACFGDDLPGPDLLKNRELCWDDEAYRITNVLIPALKAGWRPFSLHSFGSEAFRKHVAWIERARQEGGMSMDDIRALRIGFAHGGAVGKIPDVIALMKRYNLYVPIQPNDVANSLRQVRRYGPEGLQFLAPTKTLIEAGVNVVGETEYSRPSPTIYFNAFDLFVNRNIRTAEEPWDAGEIVMPEEAVSRATAMRLFTTKAAEWLFAEELAGSIEQGKFADFTVLDKNYFEMPQDEILDNKIIMTVVGDQIVYRDPDWQPAVSQGQVAAN
jgi:predicted amidohydrolase YtcJ